MLPLQLTGIRIENLRGYQESELFLSSLQIIIGENNEGKSSALKMIDRLVNKLEHDFWEGTRQLSEDELRFWMPANSVYKRARRLTLNIQVNDGRIGRKFGVEKGGNIELRFGIKKVGQRARLNIGRPRKAETHDPKAVDLLTRLQDYLSILYVAPIRDAQSSSYTVGLLEDVRSSIKTSLTHQYHGGTSKDYRLAKAILDTASEIVGRHSEKFDVTDEKILSRMLKDSDIRFTASINDVMRWLLEHIGIVLSTGAHDELMVDPTEVGNGLQSIIDLSISVSRATREANPKKAILIIIEEPEAFLHPSAQRELMVSIRERITKQNVYIVMTTHSTIVVDESLYPEVVLARAHQFYQPVTSEATRGEINTMLMGNENAETFFSNSVLLVEGQSDRAFFNSLLQRLRQANPSLQNLNKVNIQSVNGKNLFMPWIQLLSSYERQSNRPIRWLCLSDGDALERGDAKQSSIDFIVQELSSDLTKDLKLLTDGFESLTGEKADKRDQIINDVNTLLASLDIIVLPWDIEWEISRNLSSASRQDILSSLGITDPLDKVEFARKIGSKYPSGKKSKGAVKPAYLFAKLGQATRPGEISAVIKQVLENILKQAELPRLSTLRM